MRVEVRESTVPVGCRVDTVNGIIYNVKVLGFKSRNRRHYPKNLLRRKYGVYEGAQVYLDHDYEQKTARPMQELGGTLKKVRFKPDGVRADLHVMRTTKAGQIILEAAQKAPNKCGLSPMHVIEEHKRPDGWTECKDIFEVKSVDFVTRPATNDSIFEAEMADEQEIQEDVKTLEAAFADLIECLIREGHHDHAKKVLKMHEDINSPADEEETEVEGGAGGEEEEVPADEAEHMNLANTVKELQTRILCMESTFTPSDEQFKEILASKEPQKLIKEYKAKQRSRPAAARIKSAAQTVASESVQGEDEVPLLSKGADRNKVAAWLRS